MKVTPEHNERIAKMTFASVYPHYIVKVESKARTKAELHQVIEWLTGFDKKKLKELKNISGQSFTISRAGFESGLYFVRLLESDRIVGIGKLIVVN